MHSLRGEARLKALGEVVTAWRVSEKSQAAFSREVGVAPVTLSRWAQELEASKQVEHQAPVFVELGSDDDDKRAGYEVRLPGGTHVRVPEGFREPDLVRLLRVLSAAC